MQSVWIWRWERIVLFSCERYIQEGEAVSHGKQAWIKHNFYSVPENGSGCIGGLRLIGEGLWWSHQRKRNDSVGPAERSRMLPAFGLHSEGQDAWPGLVVVLQASGSKDKQGSLFLKESGFLTCSFWTTAVQDEAEPRQALFLSCLASSIEISLNPKSPAWTHWALRCSELNLDAHADLEAYSYPLVWKNRCFSIQ